MVRRVAAIPVVDEATRLAASLADASLLDCRAAGATHARWLGCYTAVEPAVAGEVECRPVKDVGEPCAGCAKLTGVWTGVKVRRGEGASHPTPLPEPCVGRREAAREASAGVHVGKAIERRKWHCSECRGFLAGRRQQRRRRFGEPSPSPRRLRTIARMHVHHRDLGELRAAPTSRTSGPRREGRQP